MKALVADDSSAMLHVLKKILHKIGIEEVLTAANGEKAWELLESESGIDLVFADLKMPRVSGIALLDRVRASAKLGALPVVIISSEAETATILEAGRHGATAYVVKPFSVEKITGVVKKILRPQDA
jgi:two-component system chemotaxis response regulator CheY